MLFIFSVLWFEKEDTWIFLCCVHYSGLCSCRFVACVCGRRQRLQARMRHAALFVALAGIAFSVFVAYQLTKSTCVSCEQPTKRARKTIASQTKTDTCDRILRSISSDTNNTDTATNTRTTTTTTTTTKRSDHNRIRRRGYTKHHLLG